VRLLHLRCAIGRVDLFSARSAYLPVLSPIFCAGLWISHELCSRSHPESVTPLAPSLLLVVCTPESADC
jgi:hypothetical protein